MLVTIIFGDDSVDLDIPEKNLISALGVVSQGTIENPAIALRMALENPFRFPPLRRALTPDDQVTIVLDEELKQIATYLIPLLEHLAEAGISAGRITLLCKDASTEQPWLDELPDAYEDVRIVIHDPDDRKQLNYLATTKSGRRVYLNKWIVEADQIVVLGRRIFSADQEDYGAETIIFPDYADRESQKLFANKGKSPTDHSVLWNEATEIAWLLGAPFFVQIIENADFSPSHIVAGTQESSIEGKRLLNSRWRMEFPEPADLVIAAITGQPGQELQQIAKALAAAAKVTKVDGKIALLTDFEPEIHDFQDHFEELLAASKHTEFSEDQTLPLDSQVLTQWSKAQDKATLYLLSKLSDDAAEDLMTIPLHHAREVQKLLRNETTCIVLPDAHLVKTVLRPKNQIAPMRSEE